MRPSYSELSQRSSELSKQIEESSRSFEAVKDTARRLGVWEDRHPARVAAELLVSTRAHGWETIASYLAYRSVSARDPVRNVLRPALRAAMLREGVPHWVDRLARQYYEKPTPVGVPDEKVQELVRLLDAEASNDDRNAVFVPTIWQGWDAFQNLQRMMSDISSHSEREVMFDFSRCNFLSPVGVAVLGGTARSLESEGREVIFRWDSFARRGVRKNLEQNGFAALHGLSTATPWSGNSVHYREDTHFDKQAMVGYLTNEWLAEDWILLNDDLRAALAGTVAEIYLNAFEHSGSSVGIFTCGQHYPNKRRLSLTVADFGRGIPANVREHLGEAGMSGAKALAWAFERGNTTSEMEVGRGLGLDLLRQFVHVNKGSLEIYSGDGLAHLGSGLDRLRTGHPVFNDLSEAGIGGTVVSIDMRCDDILYVLESETPRSDDEYF
jgi:signal transduction histidine kinase